jgi:hypothetical protein
LCLVPGTLGGEPALGERIVAIGFETRWSKRGEDGHATAPSICTAPTLRQ